MRVRWLPAILLLVGLARGAASAGEPDYRHHGRTLASWSEQLAQAGLPARREAAAALAHIAAQSAPAATAVEGIALAQLPEARDALVRERLVSALGFVARPGAETQAAIRGALEDASPDVVSAAVRAIGRRSVLDAVDLEGIARAFEAGDGYVRRQAARVLAGQFKLPPDPQRALLAALADPSPGVRQAVLIGRPKSRRSLSHENDLTETLGAFRDLPAAAAPLLKRALDSQDPEVRALAAGVLIVSGLDPVPFLDDVFAAFDALPGEPISQAIGSLGPVAVSPLAERVRSPDAAVAEAATKLLGELDVGDDAVGHALAAAAQHADVRVRRAAMQALARHPAFGDMAVAVLLKALQDPDSAVQRAAAGASGSFPAQATRLVPALVEMLARVDSFDGSSAIYALSELARTSDEALEALAGLVQHEKAGLALDAVRHLRRLGNRTQDVAAALQASAPAVGDDRVRQALDALLQGLGMQGPPDVETLIARLRSEDGQTRRRSLDTLAELGPAAAKALPEVIALLREGRESSWTLKKILAGVGPALEPYFPQLLDVVQSPGEQSTRAMVLETMIGTAPGNASLRGALPSLLDSDSDSLATAAAGIADFLDPLREDDVALLERLYARAQGRSRAALVSRVARRASGDARGIPLLLRALEDEDREVRRAALTGLYNAPASSPPDVAAVIRVLASDPDESLRGDALRYLAWHHEGSKDAAAAVITALGDGSAAVRAGAADALGHFGPTLTAAQGRLLELLEDPSPEVRQSVAAVLVAGRLHVERAFGVLLDGLSDSDAYRRKRTLGAIRDANAPTKLALAAYVQGLEDPDAGVRAEAADQFRFCGSEARPALPALLAALSDPDADVRAKAAGGIASVLHVTTGIAPAPYLQAFRDGGPEVRGNLIWMLGRFGRRAREMEPDLREYLEGKREGLRISSAIVLLEIGAAPEPSLRALGEALDAEDPRTLSHVLYTLQNAHAALRPLLPRVRALLEHADEDVRNAAYYAYMNMPGRASDKAGTLAPILRGDDPKDRKRALTAFEWSLRPYARRHAEDILALVDDPDVEVRKTALWILLDASLPAARMLPVLRKALADPSAEVRFPAAAGLRALGRRAAPAREELETALKDGAGAVRVHAAAALRRIGALSRAQLLDLLVAGTRDVDARTRSQSAWLLGVVDVPGAEAAAALRVLLGDRESWIRGRAIRALGELGPYAQGDVEGLAAVASDGWVQEDAVSALARLAPADPRTLSAIVSALDGPTEDIREMAAWALARLGARARDAEPRLVARLSDSHFAVRRQAARSLAELGSKGADVLALLAQGMDLDDDLAQVWLEAARLLDGQEANDAPAAKALRAALGVPDAVVREEALAAVATLGVRGEAFVPEVAQRLADTEASTRAAAARALGVVRCASDRLPAALVPAWNDSAPAVRLSALTTLFRIDRGGAKAAPVLVKALGDDDLEVRRVAAHLLCALDKGPGVEAAALAAGALASAPAPAEMDVELAKALAADDADARLAALLVVGARQDLPEALLGSVLACASDDRRSVRAAAMRALGCHAGAHAGLRKRLRAALEDPAPDVQAWAAAALLRAGGQESSSRERFARYLASAFPEVRLAALTALHDLGPRAGNLADLVDAMPAETEVRLKVWQVLTRARLAR